MIPAFKEQLTQNPELLLEILQFSPLPSRLIEAIRSTMQKVGPAQQQAQQLKQLQVSKLVADINQAQSVAELNNAKAGATAATAEYDLAMAQNLLLKHRGDLVKAAQEWQKQQRENQTAGLDAMHKVAQIDETRARAEKTRAETHGVHMDTAHMGISALIDALTPIQQPQMQPQGAV
jgi:hypothetical protein